MNLYLAYGSSLGETSPLRLQRIQIVVIWSSKQSLLESVANQGQLEDYHSDSHHSNLKPQIPNEFFSVCISNSKMWENCTRTGNFDITFFRVYPFPSYDWIFSQHSLPKNGKPSTFSFNTIQSLPCSYFALDNLQHYLDSAFLVWLVLRSSQWRIFSPSHTNFHHTEHGMKRLVWFSISRIYLTQTMNRSSQFTLTSNNNNNVVLLNQENTSSIMNVPEW